GQGVPAPPATPARRWVRPGRPGGRGGPGQPTRPCHRTGCCPFPVAVEPTPVSVFPDTLRPVTCWAPGPRSHRPAGRTACQVSPSCDHQTITSWSLPSPSEPVARKPPPAVTRAVTTAGLPGTGRRVSRQAPPPLTPPPPNA